MLYVIIRHSSTSVLEAKVGMMIDKGWEPIGGVSITNGMGGEFQCAQAMVKNPGKNSIT